MKKRISLLATLFLAVNVFSFTAFADVGANKNNDFNSPNAFDGYLNGSEGHGFSIVDGECKSNSTTAYNAIYFGEYADNIVFEFDYKPNVATGEYWGGTSLRCGASGRYDVGLCTGVNHQSRVRIWRNGAEVAYNIQDSNGKGVPSLAPLQWSNVKIAMEGGRIRVFVDDMLVIDYTDSTPFTEGGFGLRAANADVSYDNIKFYPVSELKVEPMTGYTNDFFTDAMIQDSPYNDPPYMDPEGNPFEIADGALLSPDKDNYNGIYFGAAQEKAVMEFDFKDFGDGEHTGGVSLNTWTLNGGARYDISIMSDPVGDKKVVIYKGGEEVASNTDAATGKKIPIIPVGEWVNCKVVQDGGNIKVYVKDFLCVDYTDSAPLTGGYYGFRSVNSMVGYDNLKFYAISDLTLNPVTVTVPSETTTTTVTTTPTEVPAKNTASSNTTPATSDTSTAVLPILLLLATVSGFAMIGLRKKA